MPEQQPRSAPPPAPTTALDRSAGVPTAPGGSLSPVGMVALFADVGQAVARQHSTAGAVAAVATVATQVVPGARWASITRGIGDRFTTIAQTDDVALQADRLQYEVGTGPCIDAVVHDSVFGSDELAADTRWPAFGPPAAELGVHSVLSIRLVIEPDDLNAGLNMYSDHPHGFDAQSQVLGMLLATHGAMAVTAAMLRERSSNLSEALASNREIGVAMGILMAEHHVTREQAFDLLRIASQNTNRKLHHIATEVADTGTLELPPRRPRAR